MDTRDALSTPRGDEPRDGENHNDREDVFPEAGKKCVTCGGKWVAFGKYVASRRCPFCGSDGARVIRPANARVAPVTRYVVAVRGLTIHDGGREAAA